MARKSPEINSGSMADISFLLLTFFLLTSSINTDMGIMRKLPPPPDPNMKQDDKTKVIERNVFVVLVDKSDRLMVEGKLGTLSLLKDQTKDFLSNPQDDPNLSEYKVENIEYLGETKISKGVISLQNDRGTSYDMYIKVQNEITAGINELRDELSRAKFGVNFNQLKNEDYIEAIKKAVPVSISEAEPKDIGGNK